MFNVIYYYNEPPTPLLYQDTNLFYAIVFDVLHAVQEVAGRHAFLACQLQFDNFQLFVLGRDAEGFSVDADGAGG